MKIGMPTDNPHPADISQDDDRYWQFDQHHHLDIIIADARWAPYFDDELKADTKQLVTFVSALLETTGFCACLRWTDDAEMRQLNAQFREQDKATNVLSFPHEALDNEAQDNMAADAPIYLGDLAFGFETMAQEAKQMDITIGAHMRHLVIHGLLHLIGCDHEDEADAEEMEGLEIAALSVIGITNPYQGDVV